MLLGPGRLDLEELMLVMIPQALALDFTNLLPGQCGEVGAGEAAYWCCWQGRLRLRASWAVRI
jgi:hypothetical protein